jgi:hypothetical protein
MALAQGNEQLSREERFVQVHKRWLFSTMIAFALWQISGLSREFAVDGARTIYGALSAGAGMVWAALNLFLVRRTRTIHRDPQLRAAFQDERMRDIRLRAFRAAFVARMAGAAILGVLPAAYDLKAQVATKLVIVVGVVAFLTASLVLDRD